MMTPEQATAMHEAGQVDGLLYGLDLKRATLLGDKCTDSPHVAWRSTETIGAAERACISLAGPVVHSLSGWDRLANRSTWRRMATHAVPPNSWALTPSRTSLWPPPPLSCRTGGP